MLGDNASRAAHAHVSMDKLATTFAYSPVSPVTSGDAVAQTTSVEIEAPFLPGTVIKKGAMGPTFRALQARLHLLYTEGFIPISPYEPFNEYEYMGGIYAHRTWECVKAYINQGISYKYKNPAPFMKQRTLNGNYDVDNWIWESLDLPVAIKLSDFFRVHPQSRKSTSPVTLSLADNNTIVIEYRPKFFIQRFKAVSTSKEWNIMVRPIDAEDILPTSEPDLYEKYIRHALNGFMHWKKEQNFTIHGIRTNVDIKIFDKNEKEFAPIMWNSASAESSSDIAQKHPAPDLIIRPQGILSENDIRDANGNFLYDFFADNMYEADILIHENTSMLASMVWDAVGSWSVDSKKQMIIRTQLNSTIYPLYDFTFEHEFGHVLGLFDIYGYAEHFIAGGLIIPEAKYDIQTARYDSVMRCLYDVLREPKDRYIENKTGKGPKRPWLRTPIDWEMILWAWHESCPQNYTEKNFGKLEQSQAFFYSNHKDTSLTNIDNS